MKTTPGNALNNEISQWLLHHPKVALVWRQNSGKFRIKGHLYQMGYTGQADVCGMMIDGRHFQFEGKAGDDKPSRAQLDNVAHINVNGGMAQVVYCLDDVKNRFAAEGY